MGPELAGSLLGGGVFAVEGGGEQRHAFGDQFSLSGGQVGALAEAAELFLEETGLHFGAHRVEDRDAMSAVEFCEFVERRGRRRAFVFGGLAGHRLARPEPFRPRPDRPP